MQAYTPTLASNPVYAPVPVPAPSPPILLTTSRTPSPPILQPVQVPPGCYPIELMQFWRDEHTRGQPYPLHWALLIRTTPRPAQARLVPGPTGAAATAASARPRQSSTIPRGNFYEVAGTQETYTAQFLHGITFEPEALPDWRGTHVIGWVSPGQVPVFERVAKQMAVWRHRADWQGQHWVYEVVCAVAGNHQGVYTDGVAFGGLQTHMRKLLEAWENGDI